MGVSASSLLESIGCPLTTRLSFRAPASPPTTARTTASQTMVDEPYVNHIPTMIGGVGRAELTAFYRDHFIFSNPPDATLSVVSRTVGIDRIVDEFIFSCTHSTEWSWL